SDLFSENEDQGQVSKALSDQYFPTWGKLYLPTLIRSHQLQQRNNFKDVGVQRYGTGQLFCSLVESIDQLYSNLPAPKPSVVTEKSVYINNMASLNDSDNSCFDGDGFVSLANGEKKQVSQLRKGDKILSFLQP